MDQRERALLFGKVHYSIYFGSLAWMRPYLILYLNETLHYSPNQIGILAACRPWVSIPAGSAWCALADYYKRHRMIMAALFAASTLWTALLFVVEHPFVYILAIQLAFEALKAPVAIIADSVTMASTVSSEEYGRCRLWGAVWWGSVSAVSGAWYELVGFRGCLLTYILCAIPGVPVIWWGLNYRYIHGESPVPGTTAGHLKASPRDLEPWSADGSQCDEGERLTADTAVSEVELTDIALQDAGHGLAARDAGDLDPLLDASDDTYKEHHPEASSRAHKDGVLRSTSFADKLNVLRKPAVLVVLCKAILMGYGMGNVDSYLFLYLNELQASKRLMGLSVTFTCVSEIPIFHYSGLIIERLGLSRCFDLVLLAFVVRMASYASMRYWSTTWFVLASELLHGLTFALAWAAGTVWASKAAPPGLKATMTSSFQSCYFGLGYGLGGLLGGYIYRLYGPSLCFAAAGTIIGVGWALTDAVEAFLLPQI